MQYRSLHPKNQYASDYHLSRASWVTCTQCRQEVQKDAHFARRGCRCLPCFQHLFTSSQSSIEPMASH